MITTRCNGGVVPPAQGGSPVPCPTPGQPAPGPNPPERDGYERFVGNAARFIAEREYAAMKYLLTNKNTHRGGA